MTDTVRNLVAELRVYARTGVAVPAEVLRQAADAIEGQARRLDAQARPRPTPIQLGPPLGGRAGMLVLRLRGLLAPQPPIRPALTAAPEPVESRPSGPADVAGEHGTHDAADPDGFGSDDPTDPGATP